MTRSLVRCASWLLCAAVLPVLLWVTLFAVSLVQAYGLGGTP